VPDITVKENLFNKQDSLVTDGSGSKYPTVDAVNAGIFASLGTSGTSGTSGTAGTTWNIWVIWNNIWIIWY
jgi:hypothetical protein